MKRSRVWTRAGIAAAAALFAACASANRGPVDIEPYPEDGAASADDSAALPADPSVRVGTLENGLTYYVRENAEPEHRATLRLALDVGSILEDDDQLGLAHMLEHLAFRGTASFDRDDIIGFLEHIGMRFGAHINAHVNFEETVYRLDVPTEDDETIERAVHIMEEWAHRIRLDPDDIDRERGVVVEEWRQRLGATQRILDAQLPTLLRGSRYPDRMPLGDMEVIRTFEPEALERFYRDWYRPDLMAVVAVGDFDADHVEGLIKRSFGRVDMPDDPRERERFGVPGHDEPLYTAVADPEQQRTEISITNKARIRPVQTERAYREQLANDLYARMINARFSELARGEDAPILHGSAQRLRLVGPVGAYELAALVDVDAIDEGLAALVREAMRVQEFGFTDTELERAVRDEMRIVERRYRQRDRIASGNLAHDYVRHFIDGDAFPGIEREYELHKRLLPTITLEEVNALADHYLAEENRVVAVSMPEVEGVEVPDDERLAAAVAGVRRDALSPHEDAEVADRLATAVAAPGEVVGERVDEALGTHEWTLSNGARVVVMPTEYRNDEILFGGFSYGGTSSIDDDDQVNVRYATRLVVAGGVADHSERDLERMLSGRDVAIEPYIQPMRQGFKGAAAPEDLDVLLQLVGLYHLEPRRDDTVFSSVRRQIANELENTETSPGFQFNARLNHLLWDGHPRRRLMTSEQLEKLDYDRALEIYRERFANPGAFTYIFVGDIDLDAFRPLAERHLAGLPALDREDEIVDRGLRFTDGAVEDVVRSGLAPRGHVALFFHGDHDFGVAENLRLRALAEALGSQLHEVLRDEEGAVYSVNVRGSPVRYPWPRFHLQIEYAADPEAAEELVERTRQELARVRGGGLKERFVERAIEAIRRQHETASRTNEYWLSDLDAMYYYQLDRDDIVRFPELIDALSVDAIADGASDFLPEDRLLQLLLLPAEGG